MRTVNLKAVNTETAVKGERKFLPLLGITLVVCALEFLCDYANVWTGWLIGPWVNSIGSGQIHVMFAEHVFGWWRIVPMMIYGVAAMLVFRCSLREMFILPGSSKWSLSKTTIVVAAIAVLELSIILSTLWSRIEPEWYWSVPAGNLFSNLYEELLFRAFMFGMVLKVSKRPFYAMSLVAFVFTWHHSQYMSWELFGFFFLAFPFAYITWKTRWILPAYVLHMVIDMVVDYLVIPSYLKPYISGMG